MLQTSFEEALNLTAYACQEARVQLGAINKFGVAETNYAFHTSLTIDVYGGTERERERERERCGVCILVIPARQRRQAGV